MTLEGEGRCCVSCNRRLPLYQCYQCSTSSEEERPSYPTPAKGGKQREKATTDSQVDRKVSVKFAASSEATPKSTVELGKRMRVKLRQPPEPKVKVKIEAQEEEGGGGGSGVRGSSDEDDDSQALPVQFDDATDKVSVIHRSFTFINNNDDG